MLRQILSIATCMSQTHTEMRLDAKLANHKATEELSFN